MERACQLEVLKHPSRTFPVYKTWRAHILVEKEVTWRNIAMREAYTIACFRVAQSTHACCRRTVPTLWKTYDHETRPAKRRRRLAFQRQAGESGLARIDVLEDDWDGLKLGLDSAETGRACVACTRKVNLEDKLNK